jgi:hypothetical protein
MFSAAMSTAQRDELDELAAACGYDDAGHAAGEVLGRDVDDDLTAGEADEVIEALREALEETGMDDPGNPDRAWALGTSGVAGAGWMVAPGSAPFWVLAGFAGLLWAMLFYNWAEDRVMQAREMLSRH